MSNAEITLSDYVNRLGITIPGSGGDGVTIFSLIEGGLTDEEKLRVVSLIITGHAVAFDVDDVKEMTSGNKETIGTGSDYTEPCLVEWLKKTFIRSSTAATINVTAKVYIGTGRNIHPKT